jgi:hypothetical protein
MAFDVLLFSMKSPPVDEQVTPVVEFVAGPTQGIALVAVQPAMLNGSGVDALVVPQVALERTYVKSDRAECVSLSAVKAPAGTKVPLEEKV